jgi:hypothetical protein
MPTPSGLPKVGERWTLRTPVQGRAGEAVTVTVTKRGRGDYWTLYVKTDNGATAMWVDAAYFMSQGWLTQEES